MTRNREDMTRAVARGLRAAGEDGADYGEVQDAAATGYGHADALVAWAYQHGLVTATSAHEGWPDVDAKLAVTEKGRKWLDRFAEVYETYEATD